jgi:DNA-binding MarR family transcriptional regulator
MNTSETNLQAVEKAMDAMRRSMVRARERMGEGLQLTKTQLEILFMLAESPQTTRDLAKRLFVTQSAVTQTIDTLVRRDLIVRRHGEDDRRVVSLHLSQAGQKLTDHLCGMRNRHMKALVGSLSKEELKALISITEKVTKLVEEEITFSANEATAE